MLTNNLGEETLIELLGLESAPVETQTEIIRLATEVIESRMLDQILSKLNEEEVHAFMRLLEVKSEDKSKMEKFLTEKDIDILELLKDEIAKFKEEIVGAVKGSKKQE